MSQNSSASFMDAPLLTLLQKSPDQMTPEELETSIQALRQARVNNHVLGKKIAGESKPKQKGKKAKEEEPKSIDISMFLK